jgi:hypothetical protein
VLIGVIIMRQLFNVNEVAEGGELVQKTATLLRQ